MKELNPCNIYIMWTDTNKAYKSESAQVRTQGANLNSVICETAGYDDKKKLPVNWLGGH